MTSLTQSYGASRHAIGCHARSRVKYPAARSQGQMINIGPKW